ncbi:MAG: C1 family peptidase, partial [Bacteroidales bacterium]
MRSKFTVVAVIIIFTSVSGIISAQKSGYTFTDKIHIDVTPVKDQHRTGTCWSFASISFLEAELLRMGKGEYDLSEMYLVRHCYNEKAGKYVRMQGKTNFSQGGLAHDLIMVWKKYGLVPESAYNGLVIGEDGHVHSEMFELLHGYVEGVVKNPNRKLTPVWHAG